jgi:arabinose-5-phosphate isomerase
MTGKVRSPLEVAQEVLKIEAEAIENVSRYLGSEFEEAVELLRQTRGRVVCTGMGKSGIVMKKVAATLASTGTPAFFLHPAEAIHGDLGMVTGDDVVLAASSSGSTEELLKLVEFLKRLKIPLIAITAQPDSSLARAADIHLSIHLNREACPLNLAPTASTTATLALGDALAMALLEARGFTREDFARLHPGGQLGKRLLKVADLMHVGEELPKVFPETPMKDVIYEMSRKGFGITAVVDAENRLLGCISDGDLRRALERDGGILSQTAKTCMKKGPRTIAATELASAALQELESRRITALFVVDNEGRLEGLVHLHDLWKLQLF